jgi:proteasome lid subunit RPN8/RPN11
MEQLTLSRSHAQQIIAHARAEAPLEACGLLGGKERRVLRVYPTTNVLRSPTRYEAQGEEVWAALEEMAGRGWEPDPLAIYHSHPRGPETPSETDVAQAYYPDSIYVIVAHLDRPRPSLRGFTIIEGQVNPVALAIVPDREKDASNTQLPAEDGV